VTVTLLCGLLVGVGISGLLAWAYPPRPTLAQALAAMHPPTAGPAPPPSAISAPDDAGWVSALGRPLAPLLARIGLPRKTARANLAICGRDPARHRAEQAAMALLGFLTMPALAGILALGGITVSWQLPVWAALVTGTLGLFAPDFAVAADADRRRAQLRDAVSGMLDLVAIALAGGAGVEQALRDATEDPQDWAQAALRQAIETAHLTRRPPWAALADLGTHAGLPTLNELSAALSLAGSEGARIKASLSARSAALSAHQLADAEATAMSATEAMVLPVVVLMTGFLVFIGFPAFAAVLAAL
jgi:Flp pilus assembly protein TadB